MIQRIQTIWLLLVAICAGLAFFFPFGVETFSSHGLPEASELQLLVQENSILLTLLSSIILGALITIFLFKNRNLQKTLCFFILLESLICIGFMVYTVLLTKTNAQLDLAIGAPALAFVFAVLAYIGINKDDKLVKNTDRLR